MPSEDHEEQFPGRISEKLCIGVYSDDGLHYIIVMAVFFTALRIREVSEGVTEASQRGLRNR